MYSQPSEVIMEIESQENNWLGQLDCLFIHYDKMASLLQRASQLAVEILDVEHCAITWLMEEKSAVEVQACYHHNGKNGIYINTQQAGSEKVAACMAQIENQNRNGNMQLRRPAKDKLAAPLYIQKEIIGYLCVAKRRSYTDARFSSIDSQLFFALSRYLGHAIEMQQMRQLLASRYASIALGRNASDKAVEQDGSSTNFIEAVKYPNKVAKIIAKSFYKDLRKAGFEPKQILVVASEIIENLNETFRKTKAKTEEPGS
ncbi:MAG: GAF domain-containing protein [bacterium]